MTPEQIQKLPKWAQAEFKELKQKHLLSKALCWPSQPPPIPADTKVALAGKGYDDLFIGWGTHNYGSSYRVSLGCCNTLYHSDNCITDTRSQGTGTFYHTKTEALIAVRWAMCNEFAKALAQVDAELETAHTAETSRIGKRVKS